MSRRICVGLYHELVSLRPEWHADEDYKGVLKVVTTTKFISLYIIRKIITVP